MIPPKLLLEKIQREERQKERERRSLESQAAALRCPHEGVQAPLGTRCLCINCRGADM